MTFDDLGTWARGSGLEIVLLVTGSVLLVRFVRWAAGRTATRLDESAKRQQAEDLVASEQTKHLHALTQAVAWGTAGLVYFVVGVLVLQRLNVPLTSLVAPATVVGVALGFGAQRVVADLLSGFFLFAERQYGFGDVVRISPPGVTEGISGTVEELTLRTTRLRTLAGEVVTIPNGEIRQVTNLSRDWARVVIDVPLSSDEDIERASEVLHRVGEEVSADPAWSPLLLDPPTVMGVERIDLGSLQLRFVARTLPAKQWDVGRELRFRVATALRRAGIATASDAPPAVRASGA